MSGLYTREVIQYRIGYSIEEINTNIYEMANLEFSRIYLLNKWLQSIQSLFTYMCVLSLYL